MDNLCPERYRKHLWGGNEVWVGRRGLTAWHLTEWNLFCRITGTIFLIETTVLV